MARDYANRKKGKAKRKKASQANRPRFSFASFILGMIVGVGLFLVTAYAPELFSRKSPLTEPATADVASEPPPAEAGAAVAAAAPADAPQQESTNPAGNVEFVFRDLLLKDAPPPDITAYEPINAPPIDGRSSNAQTESQYLLQSGSFQILADAQRRRGQLLLMDLPANVVEATVNDNIWYRVVVGPFDSQRQANRVVTALRERQIAAIWLARPVTN